MYQIGDEQSPVFLPLYGEFEGKDDATASSLKEIIYTQRSFFNDYEFPYYAISLTQGGDLCNWGETGLSNSFIAFLPQSINRTQYYPFFAHEHLHTWIGGKIHNNDPEELNYWWSEGFTDYYSMVLSLRSGGITL